MKPYLNGDRFLSSPKDPLNKRKISGIVYQVLHHDCKFTDIGQMKLDLKF